MQNRSFTRSIALMAILAFFGAAGLLPINVGSTSATAIAAAIESEGDVETFDRIHLSDGRTLEGKIENETRTTITFRIIDREIGLSVTRELDRREVREIERDIPYEVERADVDPSPSPEGGETRERPRSDRPRGLGEGDPNDESLPSFYLIPMEGQMGTDVHPDAYRGVVEDIKRVRPDYVIWVMDSSDVDDDIEKISYLGEFDREEVSLGLIDEYRELVRMLRNEIPGELEQVMWVKDAHGFGSLVALAWPKVYMAPNARLGGIARIAAGLDSISDEDVRGKMVSATVSNVSGFLQRGGRGQYADALARAMVLPEYQLSASWHGREVTWRLDTRGDYVVNGSTERTVTFRAEDAEKFMLSNGTAETVDDLALLLGEREYRVLEGESHRLVERYIDGWRRAWDRTQTLIREYQEYRGRASGDRARQWLGQAANNLRQIISLMNRYPAVDIRFQIRYGVGKFELEMTEEELREQIRRGGRGGGGRGPGGPGGGRSPR